MTTVSFFPAAPALSMEYELRLRALARDLPEEVRCQLYELMSDAHEYFVSTRFELGTGTVTAVQDCDRVVFPRPLPMVKFSHILCRYETWLQHKYCLPDFVSVETGDVVIDCGAYVGGFSLSAAKLAAQVYLFEPEEKNFACCVANLSSRPNVQLERMGLYSQSQEMSFNIAASSVEHSLLAPDDGSLLEQRTIRVVSLSDYCASAGINRIDFLKLEAEGVELEIFEGLAGFLPKKLAIDVSPERDGVSPATDFWAILEPLGYEIRQRANVLFARLSQ